MDSEMSNCCWFLLRLLILVQKTAHARGLSGSLGAWREGGIGCCLTLAGHLFLKRFLGPFFHQQTPTIVSKWSQNHSKNTLLHNTLDLDFCCYLQHFVAIEPPNTTQKVLQNRIKKSTAFRTSKSHPISSQKVPKRVRAKRGWRLLGHLWRPNLFFDAKSVSKGLQK